MLLALHLDSSTDGAAEDVETVIQLGKYLVSISYVQNTVHNFFLVMHINKPKSFAIYRIIPLNLALDLKTFFAKKKKKHRNNCCWILKPLCCVA